MSENSPAGAPDSAPAPRARATIADVAARAGVSRAAVSKVFNRTGSISVDTTERIRQAARDLNWTPSATATALRRSRSHTIGLVLDKPSDRVDIGLGTASFLAGIQSELAPLDYGLLLHAIDREPAHQLAAYRTFAETRRVDGMILTDSVENDPRFPLLAELGFPAVLVGTPFGDEQIVHVESPDPEAGVVDTAEHLLGLGHRRIAYFGGSPGRYQSEARRTAFVDALARRGIEPVSNELVDYNPKRAAAATVAQLRSESPPTALVYASDAMAIAGIQAATELGLSVPHDVSVIGYGGVDVGEWMTPSLTTVRRDSEQRGRAAAITVLRLLGERPEGDATLENPELVVRGSTSAVHD
ncbi:LacI family DNA-binding transcriptional regulator [Microbacterium sp. MPKO10]|uniref:LacI family DNA-binding transcriptional regulator n=1 Tax=Microbacterium sp. MPKO10 TaxID=2989818 RepID=UPI002235F0FF|nr:LacI family DNA-binding transcriptional regulator [Microbacterium sp. MPKO10]MCW4459810.1 LacI family transcriptional regulator [Microbacterium sp. MPKO10]